MVIPVGFAQVNLRFTGTAVPTGAEMTFGVQNVAALTADALADSVGDDWVGTAIEGFYVPQCQLNTIHVKLGPNSTGAMSDLGYVAVGTATGTPASPAVAALISKITGLGGREGRGRMFFPGLSETSVDVGGVWLAQASHQAACSDFLADLEASGTPMVLLHNSGTSPTPVTSLNVSPTLATQRRRQRR